MTDKELTKKQGHLCGGSLQAATKLFAPVDIEGHIGSDNRKYVIDLARVFPPTYDEDVKKTYLYKVFRPEFVRKYPVVLVPSHTYNHLAASFSGRLFSLR